MNPLFIRAARLPFGIVLVLLLTAHPASAMQNTLPTEKRSESIEIDDVPQPRTGEEEDPTEQEGWIPLFNGKDLTGWTAKIVGHELGDNYADTFRVEDGLLTVSYDKYKSEDFEGGFKKFGHLFHEGMFSHYRLRIEYRFVGEQCPNGPGWAWRNSGVMLHGQDPKTMDVNQDFPVSIEAQFLGGDGTNPRSTLNLCTPGTNVVLNGKLFLPHCTNSNSATFHGDDWVTVEIEVLGSDTIKHLINDQVVLEYAQPQYDERDATARPLIKDGKMLISEGTLSLQSESHGIQFRKVELKQLAKPIAR